MNIPKLGRVSASAALATSAARIAANEACVAPIIGFSQTAVLGVQSAVLGVQTAVLAVAFGADVVEREEKSQT